MSIFDNLVDEFAAMTGLPVALDGHDFFTLRSNDVEITVQYRCATDDVVLVTPVAGQDGEELSGAVYVKALELAYNGHGTAGAFLGLLDGALILTRHLPLQGLDAPMLGIRLTEFADAAETLKAELAAVQEQSDYPAEEEHPVFSGNQIPFRV